MSIATAILTEYSVEEVAESAWNHWRGGTLHHRAPDASDEAVEAALEKLAWRTMKSHAVAFNDGTYHRLLVANFMPSHQSPDGQMKVSMSNVRGARLVPFRSYMLEDLLD